MKCLYHRQSREGTVPERKVMDDDSSRFTVTLPKAVTEQFDAIAAERGSKRAAIMREAALFYLKCRTQNKRRAS